MFSSSLLVNRASIPGFFDPVDQGDPLNALQEVKRSADNLLSFGHSIRVLKLRDDHSFAYVDGQGKRLHPALKAVLCFALIVAPLARLLHALWTKRPINASLAVPLALPMWIFLAKCSFRSNLKSVPSRLVYNKNGESIGRETGLFRNGKLIEGKCAYREGNGVRNAQGWFNLQAIFEVAKDPSRASPIRACTLGPVQKCFLGHQHRFQPLEVIEFLTNAENGGSGPRFTQLSNESFLEFTKLAVDQVESLTLDQITKLRKGISDERINKQQGDNVEILQLKKLILITQEERLCNRALRKQGQAQSSGK